MVIYKGHPVHKISHLDHRNIYRLKKKFYSKHQSINVLFKKTLTAADSSVVAVVVVVVEVFQVEVAVQLHTVPVDFVENYHKVDLLVMGSPTELEQSQKLHWLQVSVEDLEYMQNIKYPQ